ncbi:16S rRNA (uracil(1498)-N(3))-methyltransferase [Peptostreptococcus anaerobius]|uniref:16S rRNA (uracil(1498)-N(3))-methyltransferase n=1 Tax=Peptostreptococcus anaerobius TaxID=1261 RepID=UPI0034A175F5
MDRFFVDRENIDTQARNLVILGDDVKHISKVLRYSVGDELEVCDGQNKEYICRINSMDKTEIGLSIIEEKDVDRESPIRIKLYQGLPKSTKMEIILQKLTECGVAEIILVNTARSVVNIDDKKSEKKLDRWQRIVYEAAKQSKRGIIPDLKGIYSFKEALRDMEVNDINIMPYEEEGSLGIKDLLRSEGIQQIIKENKSATIGIFIGPEGGFTEDENAKVKEAGGHSVKMGPRIFRTETASIVATSICLYELGDIGGM